MEYTDKIYVAGHTGMVGSAILRLLKGRGYKNIVVRPHGGLDLTRQGEVARIPSDNNRTGKPQNSLPGHMPHWSFPGCH